MHVDVDNLFGAGMCTSITSVYYQYPCLYFEGKGVESEFPRPPSNTHSTGLKIYRDVVRAFNGTSTVAPAVRTIWRWTPTSVLPLTTGRFSTRSSLLSSRPWWPSCRFRTSPRASFSCPSPAPRTRRTRDTCPRPARTGSTGTASSGQTANSAKTDSLYYNDTWR